ncbi:MAG: cation diffusion facilitator family transporter, partial [Nitrososphaerota archaeon]
MNEEYEKRSWVAEQRSLIAAISLTGFMMALEIIGSILSNSLALLSDAWHMFTDLLALTTCLIAGTLATKPPSLSKSFGYHRTEILAALGNGIVLLMVVFFVYYQAILRILQPFEVKSFEMFTIALIGLSVNVASLSFLWGKARGLNVKAAFLHILGDALSSVGVVVAAIAILFTGWYLADPIASIIIGTIILYGTVRMLKEVLHILLEGTPFKIDVKEVLNTIRGVKGVADVHDLHIWSITSYQNYLIAHIVVKREGLSNINEILNDVKLRLAKKFDISHTTLQ